MLIYSCPNPRCEYSISEVLRDNVRFDYPCPKCGKSNITDYYVKQKFNHRTTANVRLAFYKMLTQISKLTSYIRKRCTQ